MSELSKLDEITLRSLARGEEDGTGHVVVDGPTMGCWGQINYQSAQRLRRRGLVELFVELTDAGRLAAKESADV